MAITTVDLNMKALDALKAKVYGTSRAAGQPQPQ